MALVKRMVDSTTLQAIKCIEKQATIVESNSVSVSVSNNDVNMLWHRRLGHPNFFYLKHMLLNLFVNKKPSSFNFEISHLAKHTRTSFLVRPCKESHPSP